MDIETLALAKKYTDEHGGGGGGTTYTAGDGIKIQHNEISVKTKSNGGITVNSDGVSVDPNTIQTKLTAGNGINISSNTIFAKLKSNQGLNADTNGVYVDKNSTLEIDTNNKLGVASSIVTQVQASIMHGEASGSVASFNDGGDNMPLKSCMVYIEPLQSGSGDASPQNERPISGWTECNISDVETNMWDEVWESGTITVNGDVTDATKIRSKNYIPIKPNKSYYIYSDTNTVFLVYDKNKNVIRSAFGGYDTVIRKNQVLNIPNNDKICYCRFYKADTTEYNNNVSINYPSTDTSYHAYNGNTYNIEFPSQAGNVYGGTLDVTNGVLIVDRVMVTYDGTEDNWLWLDTYKQAYINLPQTAKYSVAEISWKCNILRPVANTSRPSYIGNFSSLVSSGAASAFSAPNCTTLEEFKTWVSNNNIQFCYELATPITYQLTPTQIKSLLGVNNIFADTGDIINLYYYTQNARDIADAVMSIISNNE